MRSVLVLAAGTDPHALAVCRALDDLDTPVGWVDPGLLLCGGAVSVELDASGAAAGRFQTVDGGVVEWNDVGAVYNREWSSPRSGESKMSIAVRQWIESDAETNLDFAMGALDGVPWIGHPDTLRAARCRASQLQVAQQVGLRVPNTCWTNIPEVVRDLRSRTGGPILGKPQHSIEYERGGREHAVWASRLEDRSLRSDASIEQVIGCYQAEVPRIGDWRVVVVDERVFSAEVRCELGPEAGVDIRGRGTPPRFVAKELPPPTASRVAAFTARCHCRFAVLDLLETADGEFWFLEANINGNWRGFERDTGAPVAAALARALCDYSVRFGPGPGIGVGRPIAAPNSSADGLA